MLKVIAIIPARGGSKSIPKKNIKLLGDKPLIAYPIELAKSIEEIDRVIVSTDSEEISQVAREYGAEIPFIRPSNLAEDETPTLPVLRHCVDYLEKTENYKPDVIIHLFATNPFLKKETVREAIKILEENPECNSVISVEKDDGRFWKYDQESDTYTPFYPLERVNRQYYKPLLKENGAIYFSRYSVIMDKNKIVDDKSIRFIIMKPGELIDIDTPNDWKNADDRMRSKNNMPNREPNVDENKKMGKNEQEINIGNKTIGERHPCFIIAEAGSNHNRDLDTAKKMVDVAVEAGADAIKFQTYSADTLYSKKAPRLSEMDGRTGERETPYDLIKRLEMPREWHQLLLDYCKTKKIMFISTPFDYQAVEELEKLDMPIFKISGYDLSNIPFVKHIAKKNKPIMMSTGVSNLEDVREAVDAIKSQGNKQIILLQCTNQYPTAVTDMNIRVMQTLQKEFNTLVGLSSHCEINEPALAAVAMGANVIEKHFTLDKSQPGPDHQFALNPDQLKDLVTRIRLVEKALGNSDKQVLESEKENSRLAKRSIHANQNINKGQEITKDMLSMKRPALGIQPKHINLVIGSTAKQDIEEDQWITEEMIENYGEER